MRRAIFWESSFLSDDLLNGAVTCVVISRMRCFIAFIQLSLLTAHLTSGSHIHNELICRASALRTWNNKRRNSLGFSSCENASFEMRDRFTAPHSRISKGFRFFTHSVSSVPVQSRRILHMWSNFYPKSLPAGNWLNGNKGYHSPPRRQQ